MSTRVHKANPSRAEPAEVVRIVRGLYAYAAGVSGTVIISGDVMSWSARSTLAGATITIDGGDSIPTRGGSVGGEPHGSLVNPTFVFTNTDAYYIEYVT